MYIEDADEMPGESRVWIYQSSRKLTDEEVARVEDTLQKFCSSWQTHGADVRGSFLVKENLFIQIIALEPADGVSGCSIDSSVAVMKQIEQDLGISLFDRQTVAWEKEGNMILTPMHEFWAMRKAGQIDDQTVVFDNLVKTWSEARQKWRTTFAQSWHSTMW